MDEGSEPGAAREQLVDLSRKCPGTSQVADGDVGVGQLDPGLSRKVGEGAGQQRPQPLRADIVPVVLPGHRPGDGAHWLCGSPTRGPDLASVDHLAAVRAGVPL